MGDVTCERCGERFSSEEELDRHLHSAPAGERPEPGSLREAYTGQGGVSESGPICEECAASFGSRDELERHTREKHGHRRSA